MIHGMSADATVAIPTLNAGPRFIETLAAVRAQRVDRHVELLVCDSGSSDGTAGAARAHGARVIEIPRASFSHGATRNLLMSEAAGDHVAFLTQDAVPAHSDWLSGLLGGFALAPKVGLVFGPYRPMPGASVSIARELTAWFDSFSDGGPRIDALEPARRDGPPSQFLGRVGFFTDANGCVARAAWERVPFRPVAYAEDHMLALDMLRGGFAKVFVPRAAVIHSHEYALWQWLRRSFDEARAVREVYDWAIDPRSALRNVRGNVMADLRWAGRAEPPAADLVRLLPALVAHHAVRAAGGLLGGRAQRLPRPVAARLSLERRG